MFADFTKREFIEAGIGGLAIIIMGYLSMLGILLLIS
jgi:hypothetical protein